MADPRLGNNRLFMSSRAVLRSLQAGEFDDFAEEEEQQEVTVEKTKQSADGSKETEKLTMKQQKGMVIDAKQEAAMRAHQERIIWRDFTFVVVALILGSIMGYIETHSGDVELRGGKIEDVSDLGIMDTGFFLTTKLHDYLEENRWVNDLLAFINTLIGVLGPFLYMVRFRYRVYEGLFESILVLSDSQLFRFLDIGVPDHLGWRL